MRRVKFQIMIIRERWIVLLEISGNFEFDVNKVSTKNMKF